MFLPMVKEIVMLSIQCFALHYKNDRFNNANLTVHKDAFRKNNYFYITQKTYIIDWCLKKYILKNCYYILVFELSISMLL